MKYIPLIALIAEITLFTFAISCNNSNSNNQTDSLERRSLSSVNSIDISSLLYTEAQAKQQYANTPAVKKPLDTFWFNILPTYKTNGQLHEIEESLEYMMIDINNNVPFHKNYSWEYTTVPNGGNLVGQYLYVTDRNKSIVPQLQKDLDTIYLHLNKEFGFYIDKEYKNITGYYQKTTIKKSLP